VIAAIEAGFQQREIHNAAYAWQKRVESGDAVVVGVNRYVDTEQARPSLLRVDEALQRTRAERLRALRAQRDDDDARRALAAIEEAARGEANLMPRILDAVERSATLGEIADVLRKVYGVHQETFTF